MIYPTTKQFKKQEILDIFYLSPLTAINCELRYHRSILKRVQGKISTFETHRMNSKPSSLWFIDMMLSAGYSKRDKIKRTIQFLNKKKKHAKEVEEAKKNNQTPPTPAYTEFDVDYIKNNTPIELVMGQAPRKKEINRHWYLCPFHHDQNPSFLWNVDKKFGYCFVCNKTGDIISLYQQINGVDFIQACKDLST